MRKRRISLKGLAAFLSVVGPGLITGSVDNDATGIAGYSIAGATYGYRFLWVLFLATIALVVIEEMAARMGIVTGKGLSDLIREEFGVRITFFTMLLLLIANAATTVANFAGIAAGMELFHIPKFISVPLAAILVWVLVVKGTYRYVEKVLLAFCLVYLTYVFSAFAVKPDWSEILGHLVTPYFEFTPQYMAVFLGTVGTTITPWMQFYLQASVADKGTRVSEYNLARWDVITGSITSNVIAFFIIVATGATLHVHGIQVDSAEHAAQALEPIAGPYAFAFFAIGLLNASLMAAAVIPLSTAYAVAEAFGWESGVDRSFSEAPQFFRLYTSIIILGAALVLLPGIPLVFVMNLPNLVGGALLPVILILMLQLVNNRRIMGAYVNGPIFNTIAWVTAAALILMTALLLVTSLL